MAKYLDKQGLPHDLIKVGDDDMVTMETLVDIEAAAYDEGYKDGVEDSWQEGYDEGYNDGHTDGVAES